MLYKKRILSTSILQYVKRWFADSIDNPLVPFILFAVLALLGFQLVDLMNVSPGLAGYDYSFFMSRLFDGILAFRAQGLAAPYYSSFLCGGFPFYADPQSLFYSVPQFLSFLIDPWKAIRATAFLFLLVGGGGAYFLARRVFSLGTIAAAGCAVLFATNGFFRSRMLIGHLTFHAFMLTPVLALLLLYPSGGVLIPALSAGLVASYFVQSGGHYVTFFAPFGVLLAAALHFAAKKDNPGASLKVFFLRSLLGMFVAAAICASKITAALNLMEHLPRPGKFDYARSAAEAARLLYAQFIDPTGSPLLSWGRWEYDMSLGAAVWPLAAIGVFSLIKSSWIRLKTRKSRAPLVSTLLFLASVFLVLGLATGASSWVALIRKVPVLDQFRVNMRFSCVLILPLCLIAAVGFDRIKSNAAKSVIFLLLLVSCAFRGEASRSLVSDYMSFSVWEVAPFFERIKKGDDVSVLRIGQKGGDDFLMMTRGEANPSCYQTFYGRPPTKKLKAGPVDTITNGNFNYINPSCYWFPDENGCHPGSLIEEADRGNFELLRSGKNPNWKVSLWQAAANKVSLLSLITVVLALTGLALKKKSALNVEMPAGPMTE